MLILTRRIDENLIIGDDGEIKVSILGVKGNQVRVGIEAPKHIAVHREEIYKKIKESLTKKDRDRDKDKEDK